MIIRGYYKVKKTVANLQGNELNELRSYIQGAVYCFCTNCFDEFNEPRWFAAKDLFGGEKFGKGNILHIFQEQRRISFCRWYYTVNMLLKTYLRNI